MHAGDGDQLWPVASQREDVAVRGVEFGDLRLRPALVIVDLIKGEDERSYRYRHGVQALGQDLDIGAVRFAEVLYAGCCLVDLEAGPVLWVAHSVRHPRVHPAAGAAASQTHDVHMTIQHRSGPKVGQ